MGQGGGGTTLPHGPQVQPGITADPEPPVIDIIGFHKRFFGLVERDYRLIHRNSIKSY
jgi:hypothetical protein